MAGELYGGSLNDFADSMAQEIEKALDEVWTEADLPPLPDPATANKQDLNNRRILFIAIARGVLRHLQKHQDSFQITVTVFPHSSVTVHPVITVKEP